MSTVTQKIYSKDGKEAGLVTLPSTIFAYPIDATVLSETLVSMQKNVHAPTSHAKDRSEVRGGGRKPWRQKGTGRARHGSIRSPIWRGGGVTHGPLKDRSHTRKINKKVKDATLAMALSGKREDGELFFVKDLSVSQPKTKEMVSLLSALLGDLYGTGSVLMVSEKNNEDVIKSMRNIPGVTMVTRTTS